MKRAFCALALPLMLLAVDASAATFRCGSKLVSDGDRTSEVENKCGAPVNRSMVGYTETPNGNIGLQVEEWVYGPTNGMTYYLRPQQVRIQANGDLVIQRALDGHFYAPGRIQGREVMFLVDTGASLVTVSETFARQAQLTGGTSTVCRTANGDRPGRIVEGIPVQIGPVEVNRVRIGIGLSVGDDNQALLGQSFLSKFDVILGKDQMVLKPR